MSLNSREAEVRHLINLGKLKDVWISRRLFTRLSLAATADEYAAPYTGACLLRPTSEVRC